MNILIRDKKKKGQPPWDFYLLVFLLVDLSMSSGFVDELCHPNCSCLDTFFQCSVLSNTFPTWITSLNVSSLQQQEINWQYLTRVNQLDTIYLDGNNLTIIPYSTLNSLPRLEHVSIARNQLDSFDANSLNPNILHVDLRLNSITTINSNSNSNPSKSSNCKLEILNLGWNLIEKLHSTSFAAFPQLVELILSKNRITSIDKDTFIKLSQLERLDLSRNRIESLDSIQFSGLTKLKELNLRRNFISVLSDGAFYGLNSLEQLYLDWNSIRVVEKRWLYGLKNLLFLSLSHNEIERIEYNIGNNNNNNGNNGNGGESDSSKDVTDNLSSCWEYTNQLEKVDLSWNLLNKLSRHSFVGLSQLNALILSHNKLDNLGPSTFEGLSELELLDLSNNELSWFVEDLEDPFKGLEVGLEELNLGSNQIRIIQADAFRRLLNLKSLNLSSNPLSWIPSSPFVNLKTTQLIVNNVNSLICDCQTEWLNSYLIVQQRLLTSRIRHSNSHHLYKSSNNGKRQHQQQNGLLLGNNINPLLSVVCGLPSEVAGTPLVQVETEQLKCLPETQKPKFLSQPKSQIFLLESTGNLQCSIQVENATQWKIHWRKNYIEISTNLHFISTNRIGSSNGSLLISEIQVRNVSWSDEGSFQCVATQPESNGVVYSKSANITIHSFPSFIKKPANVSVRLGSNAKLECAAKGFPTPEIAFQKDGGEDFPAALDRRFHVMPNDDSFFIMEVKLVDMGSYSCSAKNSAGEIKSFAAVTVYETPSFITQMQDERSVVGSNAILECPASGSPKPRISWSRNGVSLIQNATPEQNNGKYVLIENGSLLMIKNVGFNDSGRYECLLTNAVGTAKGYSTLTVVSPNGNTGLSAFGEGGLDNAAMTVIFIIIAVFCVVGTSAAWVVVIYRTRQRSHSLKATAAASEAAGIEVTPLKFEDETAFSNYPMNLYQVDKRDCHLTVEAVAGATAGSSCSSSKDSGTGEDALLEEEKESREKVQPCSSVRDRDEGHCLTTFGTRVSSPLCLFSDQQPISAVKTKKNNPISLVDEPVILLKNAVATAPSKNSSKNGLIRVSIPIPPEGDDLVVSSNDNQNETTKSTPV